LKGRSDEKVPISDYHLDWTDPNSRYRPRRQRRWSYTVSTVTPYSAQTQGELRVELMSREDFGETTASSTNWPVSRDARRVVFALSDASGETTFSGKLPLPLLDVVTDGILDPQPIRMSAPFVPKYD